MQLVWFRQDLRLVDHPALHQACQRAQASGETVEAVFFITPAQWQRHHMAAIRQRFLLERLNVLGQQLAALGMVLHVLEEPWFAGIPARLQQLVVQRGATAVHALQAIEWDERQRDGEVSRLLAQTLAVPLLTYQGCCVLAPGEVSTGKGEPFKVFTPFSRAWRQRLAQTGYTLHRAPAAQGPAVAWLPWALPARTAHENRILADWPVEEGAAEARLQQFIATDLLRYDRQRDFPAQAGTSRLSAYLAAGILSPRQCLAALWSAQGALPMEKEAPGFVWFNELIWREFYRHLLVRVPSLSRDQPFQPQTAAIRWANHPARFAAWCAGQTGFPIVDAAMRCLAQTGWMHNRLRMIVASFLTKDLHLSWRQGEDYFMRQLIDGDLAANNGGWQWAASTGADAAPYFRVFNPTTQGERFDPQGDYIRRWVPELADVPADAIHAPHAWLRQRGQLDYPLPIVDHAQARLQALALFKDLALIPAQEKTAEA